MPTRVLRKEWWRAVSATKAAILASIAVALAFGSIGYVAYTSRSNQSHNCAASLRVRDAVVLVLVDARVSVQTNPKLDSKERKRAIDFYRVEINRLKAIDCNTAP
jgi:hypothetical protein